jgi:ABC-2 type transport system ATP-binding protein
MSAPVIEVSGLRKQFTAWHRGRRVEVTAIDGLDFEVSGGGVYGFLGPNGSGKTTTIRCLLGLLSPTAGRCRVLGAESASGLRQVLDRVGAIVESPLMFPTMSATTNLELLAPLARVGRSHIAPALERVGLAERAGDDVGTFSLGMRQRLAIAAALLKDPELVILDEPANGLDPAGIKEIRELMRSLAAEGRTVFVSSHQLSEVQQSCDQVAILSRGRCLTSGSVVDVMASQGGGGMRVGVVGESLESAMTVLRGHRWQCNLDGDGALVVELPAERGAEITRALAGAGIYLHELAPVAISLEDVFLHITRDPS